MMIQAGIVIALSGFVIIIIQILIPNLVPSIILDLLSEEHPQFTGYDAVQKATLILWQISGFVLFFAGIATTFFGFKCKS